MKYVTFLLPIIAAFGVGGCQISVNKGWGDGELGASCNTDSDCQSLCCHANVCTSEDSTEPPEDSCTAHEDCFMGQYCDLGLQVCVSGSICLSIDDCGIGFVCDEQIATCVPGDPEPQCTADAECPAGSYCALEQGLCIQSGVCTADPDCGDGLTCDEARGTCIPGEDPPAACEQLATQDECLARADCVPVFTGINCSCGPDCVCQGVEPNCVCERFDYFACGPAPA